MTGIVGITAIQDIRKFKGFESAILAGGFVRDSLLGGPVKDLDIFIPARNSGEFINTIEQHFRLEEPVKPEEEVKEIKISEKEYDNWLTDQVKQGNDPWNDLIMNYSANTRTYTIYPKTKYPFLKSKLIREIGDFKELIFKKKEYLKGNPSYLGHYDGRYMGCIDVDIIGYRTDTEELFGERVVSEFPWNIDRCYFDGSETVQTKDYLNDQKVHKATLSICNNIHDLPHHMRKFERLREKYPKIQFVTTAVQLTQKQEEEKPHRNDQLNKFKYYTGSATTTSGSAW